MTIKINIENSGQTISGNEFVMGEYKVSGESTYTSNASATFDRT
jgi:hypothetical protein